MIYKMTKRGQEFELEIQYDYDFEHRIVKEDSLQICLDETEITCLIDDKDYADILAACEDYERDNVKNKYVGEYD